ncbi:hypothetical protein L6164_004410 [Bauhinia variegata]|uniref:Uncharacterized protein n=1 Tax=Bauhinia variegata TaxID=167791 RepID=A0ACB9Q4C6_BAUVA|nr:hypothetical protein L6164_004410 [Bauhinia variegata]
MPKKLQKSLHDYVFKIKIPRPQIQLPSNSFSSSKKWVLSGCKHPKTSSFAIDERNEANGVTNNNGDAATLTDVDRFLFENFKSPYIRDDEDTDTDNTKRVSEKKREEAPKLGPILFDSPRFTDPPPDLCGSNRFFVKPALSGSLLEDTLTSTGDDASSSTTLNDSSLDSHHHLREKQAAGHAIPNDWIAVLTHSPNPYEDFRQSMRDMVKARSRSHGSVDWDFMEELLFCYLNLNDKKSYKFILSAFVDLVVVLRQHKGESAAPAKPRSVSRVKIGKETRGGRK